MRTERIDNSAERQIIIGMITSTTFLRRIITFYEDDLIEAPFVRIIANWCLEHYAKYEQAPGKDIEEMYNAFVRQDRDKDMSKLIGNFLASISAEYERADKFNVQYVLDCAEQKFKERSLRNLSEDVNAYLSQHDVVNAEATISQYKRVAQPSSDDVNPFVDHEMIYEMFTDDNEKDDIHLFSYPGALGKILNDQLVREGFIGIMGIEKIGKSWMMLEFALKAAMARCNVAFFEVGDMSRKDLTMRGFISFTERSNKQRYCGRIHIPTLDCQKNQDGTCNMARRTNDRKQNQKGYSPCTSCQNSHPLNFRPSFSHIVREPIKPLSAADAVRVGNKFVKRLKGRDFKLACLPSRSISMSGIESQLDVWEHFEGFIPDLVCVENAENLAPENPKLDFRHQQNETWQAGRAMSQRRRCLVVFATQADAKAYVKETLSLSNFSEDKRKYGHVTMMLSLNQTDQEKRDGLLRVGQLLVREDDFDSTMPVTVLQCLQIGRPHLGSFS